MAADTFSNTLGYLIMGVGNDNNSWGGNCSNSVFQIFEDAVANALTSSVTGGTLDLSGTPPPAAASQVRHAALIFNGTLTSNGTVKVPNLSKFWLVQNATAGAFTLKLQTPSGSPSTAIPQNSGWQLVQCDGSNNITVSPFNSKQIQMPDGTAAAPPFSYLNEPNSLWYRAGTQDHRLSINGVDVVQVTGAGAGTPSVFNVLSPLALQIAGTQVVPAGTVVHYDGITAPTGWIFVYGQALSRPIANGGSVDTYKGIWNAITTTVVGNTNNNTSITGLASDMRALGLGKAFVEGTGIPTGTTITFTGASTATLSLAATGSNVGVTFRILPHGQGDASTTFNVRDGRGVGLFGRGDMGGTDRALITVAGGNFDGTLLGINRTAGDLAGGAQNQTLTQPQLPVFSQTPIFAGVARTWNLAGPSISEPGQVGGTLFSGGNLNSPSNAANAWTVTVTPDGTISPVTFGSGNSHPIMPPSGVSNMIMKL